MVTSSFWRDFAAVRINISLPDGRELATQEALSEADLDALCLLVGEPLHEGRGPIALLEWQRKNERCVDSYKMLANKISRALQTAFRDQRWSTHR